MIAWRGMPHAPNSRDRAFRHSWVAVGRVEDLPAPGDFLRAPLTRAGVLVTRGEDGALRAFHAVCTHRGSALFDGAAPQEGKAARFTCPYHGFEFEMDGRACAQVSNLAPVRLETAHGFLFVTLDDAAAPLAEALGEAPPWLARAGLAHSALRRARRVAYDIEARWTLVVENFQESLHFASVHPALEALTPAARAETWMPRGAGGSGPGLARPASRARPPRGATPEPWLGGIMPIVDSAETVSLSGARQGRPFVVPEEDRRVVHDAMRFPNLLTSLQPDYLLTFVLYPIGERRTRVIASTYVHADAPEGAIEDVAAFWTRVYDEDRLACERQEIGHASHPMRAHYTDVEEGVAAFAQMVECVEEPELRSEPAAEPAPEPARPEPVAGPAATTAAARLCGLFGKPFADLSALIDTSDFGAIHHEITRGLAVVETSYTGGSLKWMGVCAPWVLEDPYLDAMHAIEAMSREEVAELVALADEPATPALDLDDPALAFGDETDRPFSRAQMRLLEHRYGVYFPWKVCYHLLENDRWEDKHSGAGKDFSAEARAVFPKTVAFVESLPLLEIGRVVIFGLLANDHAPAHRDSEPGKALAIAQSISFEPSRGAPGTAGRHKRFYLTSSDSSTELEVESPIYWFNDMDWHGVHADPFFRYSVRVDGVYEPEFLERVRRETTRRRLPRA
jgi:Rieske 2Fe-2S family protein